MVKDILKWLVVIITLAIAVPLSAYWTMWLVSQAEYDHCLYRYKRFGANRPDVGLRPCLLPTTKTYQDVTTYKGREY